MHRICNPLHYPCCDISVQRSEEKTTYLLAHRVKKGVLQLTPHHLPNEHVH